MYKDLSFQKYLIAVVVISITVYAVQENNERAAWYYLGVLALGFVLTNREAIDKFLSFSGVPTDDGKNKPKNR